MRRASFVSIFVVMLASVASACGSKAPPGEPAAAMGGAQQGGAAGAGGTSGGAGSAGGGTDAGGAPGGSTGTGGGGSSGTGGTAGGAGGGSGGTAGSGGTSSEPSLEELVGALDGYLFTGECNGGSASFECPLANCTSGVFDEQATFEIGGDPATVYAVALHVYGVVELRSDYTDGVRRQGSMSNAASSSDFWYAGGSYTPGAGYNVYGLRVSPAVAGVEGVDDGGNNYFLNARDASAEAHEVWELNYDATVLVQGGGTVEFRAYDPNCLQIMNNAETASPDGDGPDGSIVVPEVESATPAPPGDFEQPLSTDGRQGQWVFIDVVDVSVP